MCLAPLFGVHFLINACSVNLTRGYSWRLTCGNKRVNKNNVFSTEKCSTVYYNKLYVLSDILLSSHWRNETVQCFSFFFKFFIWENPSQESVPCVRQQPPGNRSSSKRLDSPGRVVFSALFYVRLSNETEKITSKIRLFWDPRCFLCVQSPKNHVSVSPTTRFIGAIWLAGAAHQKSIQRLQCKSCLTTIHCILLLAFFTHCVRHSLIRLCAYRHGVYLLSNKKGAIGSTRAKDQRKCSQATAAGRRMS